jgi:hypothetical protein
MVADDPSNLERLWNPRVTGFENYGPPRLLRRVEQTQIYVVDRTQATAAMP